MKVVLFYLLNRRQPIPTEEASSQLPWQPPPAASQGARRRGERRARERERQELLAAFIAGVLSA